MVVLSNSLHLTADTGRVITCPFIPGEIPDAAMAMVVTVTQPDGAVLPELVQWLPLANSAPGLSARSGQVRRAISSALPMSSAPRGRELTVATNS